MSSFYYSEALEVFRKTRAEYVGCAPGDFDSHDLVIVPRPEGPTRKYVAMAMTLGTGTVLSVRDDYIAWCRANAPKDKHYRALFPNALLQPLAEEGTSRGESIGWRAPNLCFIPSQEPVALPIPGGFRAVQMDAAWRAQVWPTGEFHNALGELEPPEEEGFQYGLAIMDGDRIAAVAGAWDDFGGVSGDRRRCRARLPRPRTRSCRSHRPRALDCRCRRRTHLLLRTHKHPLPPERDCVGFHAGSLVCPRYAAA